jgi:hypothetical protein
LASGGFRKASSSTDWTLPGRTLWFVGRKEQCVNAEEFAKGIPNAIAVYGFKLLNRNNTGEKTHEKLPSSVR